MPFFYLSTVSWSTIEIIFLLLEIPLHWQIVNFLCWKFLWIDRRKNMHLIILCICRLHTPNQWSLLHRCRVWSLPGKIFPCRLSKSIFPSRSSLLTGALSKILEEKRKDPREHWREIASAVHSAMEELEELQAKIISLENKQGGETRLNNLMFTAKEISEN